jgi:hypothetical protein
VAGTPWLATGAGAATPGPVVYLPPPTGDPATDTPAIQQAIDASPLGARIVFGPTGGGPGYVVNRTISLLAQRHYQGTDQYGTVVQAAAGSNLAAVMAAAAWLAPAGTPEPGDPSLTIETLTIDANGPANPQGAHGLVLMNERAVVSRVTVNGAVHSGLVLADHTLADPSPTSFHCLENRFVECTVQSVGQYGIWVLDTDLSGSCTDGYLQSCVVLQAGLQAVRIERSAGWFIRDNHVYGCAADGFYLDQFWGTFFCDNEVDVFGLDAAGGPYYGVRVANVISGRPGAITGCQVSTVEHAGSSYRYYDVHGAGGVDGAIMVSANACHVDPGGTPGTVSVGFSYLASTGSTLTVRGQTTNLVDGPAVSLSATGGGQFQLVDAVPEHGVTHGVDGSDPVVLGDAGNLGYAATLAPTNAVTTVVAPGAGNAQYAMFVSGGVTTQRLRLVVGTSAGEISVGLYEPGGTGLHRVPGTRLVGTGPLPCPASGVATVLLPAAATVVLNAFGAVSVSDGRATVGAARALDSSMTAGTAAFQAAAHPLPATAAAFNGATAVAWMTSD